MRKVVLILASLAMLMLVGCGGDSGSATSGDTDVPDSESSVDGTGANVPSALPSIPAIPEE